MKITIDQENKTIEVLEDVNLQELYDFLKGHLGMNLGDYKLKIPNVNVFPMFPVDIPMYPSIPSYPYYYIPSSISTSSSK